eukprot:971681-Pyramimonas_sp.AAC.1
MVNVFADFYETLCSNSDGDSPQSARVNEETDTHGNEGVPEFTMEELETALRQLRTGKAADVVGIVAEMLK